MTSTASGNNEESYEDLQDRLEKGNKVLDNLKNLKKEAESNNQLESVPGIEDRIAELEEALEKTKEKNS